MDIKELFKKVDELCREAGVEFVFAVPGGTTYSVQQDENLKKIVEVIKTQN